MKEEVFYQKYKIHLINGEVLDYWEDFFMPEDEMDLAEWFDSADDDEILAVGDRLFGYAFVPRKSIVYIAQDGVVSEWVYKKDNEKQHKETEPNKACK